MANADSYISVVDATTYATNMGLTDFTALADGAKEIALRKATQYLDMHYLDRWKGVKVSTTQALQWPRSNVLLYPNDGAVVSSNSIPVELQRAVVEAAAKFAVSDITADVDRTVKSETVGPLTTVYADHAADVPKFTRIEQLIKPLVRTGSQNATLIRA